MYHGSDQALISKLDRNADVDVTSQDDALLVAPDGIRLWNLTYGLYYSLDEERIVGHRNAFALLKLGFYAVAILDHVGHVDLNRSPGMRRGMDAFHHVAGNRATHWREAHRSIAHERRRRGGRCRGRSRSWRRRWCGSRTGLCRCRSRGCGCGSRATLSDVLEDVFL